MIALNLIMLIAFQLSFLCSYNLAFNFGKVGDKTKLKQLLVNIGVPLLICLFVIPFLNGAKAININV